MTTSDAKIIENDNLDYDRDFMIYRLHVSFIYHKKRERFLTLCDKWSKAFSLVAGTAAFSSIVQSPEGKSIAGLFVALFSMPGLVFGWSDKAKLHSELAQKYMSIEAEIVAAGTKGFTLSACDSWHAKSMLIEMTEPTTLSALMVLAHNQIASANGKVMPARVIKLRWHHIVLANIFDFNIDLSEGWDHFNRQT